MVTGRHRGDEARLASLVILAAVILVPTLLYEKIGWLTFLVPLPVFYCHVTAGRKRGPLLIRNGILLAAGGAVIAGSLELLLFTLTMVPVGMVFAHGVFNRKTPVGTGFYGSLVLALLWLLYWSTLAVLHQTNPYAALLLELDRGLRSGLAVYEQSAELAPETLASVRRAVQLLQVYIPKILPSLMVSALLGTVWLNLTLGNWLLRKKADNLTPWPEYNEWKLPEPLVWLVVLSGMLFLLLPKPLNILGLNGLVVCSTIYFFQGLAIAASLLNRWSVPRLIRILIYALIFIQTYGIIILSFLGLADVWADFRKIDRTADSRNGPS